MEDAFKKNLTPSKDKEPSRWESDSKFPQHAHPAAASGLEPHPDAGSPYPAVLHGKPLESHEVAGGMAPRTHTVWNDEQRREAYETGDWRDSPENWDEEATEKRKKAMSKLAEAAKTVAALVLCIFGLSTVALAQTAVTQTTLSAALAAPVQGSPATTVNLASATGIFGPTAVQPGSELFVDQEAMVVQSLTGTVAQVLRGFDSTATQSHNSGAIVYSGPSSGVLGSPFVYTDPPIGACTLALEVYSLRINTRTGKLWACTAGYWANVVDAFMFVDAGQCQSSVSGNSTGTNGYTTIGTAPSLGVVQAQTSVTGTNTHYYMCSLMPDTSRLTPAKSIYVVDAEFYYGTQTTVLGTQAAVLASGTMNGKTIFTTMPMPIPAAGETASGFAEQARADTGTMTITPVIGSFNTGITTAGEFFSVKFTPATPIIVATDHVGLFLTVSLLNTATSATVTNSPGFIVHYRLAQGL